MKTTNKIFEQLTKKGYSITHKRILGNPLYTSEETKRKDLIQEYALIVEWIKVKFNVLIIVDNLSAFGMFVPNKFSYQINDYNKVEIIYYDYDRGELNSLQEATEVAILYVINNLIEK